MGRHNVLLVTLLCCHFLYAGIVKCTRSLSTVEDLDKEIHLKHLNQPSVKTIQDKYGYIHDCVDVYKQVAFDHPLLKNHTMDFQIISNPLCHRSSEGNSSTIGKSFATYLNSQVCPVGTIPIRKIFRENITGKRQIKKAKTEITNRPNTYLAIARTKVGPGKYSGVGGYIKTDNPKVVGQQFSTTRIRLQVGPDSIEAGWRVDPSLYGDSRTRLFIRTDAGKTHCFNIRCPGFIQTDHELSLDSPFDIISKPGGEIHEMWYYIIKDNRSGNWNFIVGEKFKLMGYWPSHIFTGLVGLADRVEWGGAAYSPPGTPLPPMGSGNHPIGDPRWDGYVSKMKVINERGQTVDASDIETYADNSKLYSVSDAGYHDEEWGHVIFYGGSGKP